MAVDDHGLEVLKKAGEEVTPGNKSDYYLKVNDADVQSVLESILASISSSSTDVINTFGNISSLASSTQSTIVSYTVPVDKTFFLQIIEFSGENIALYDVEISSTVEARKRSYFGGPLFGEFCFVKTNDRGLELSAGSVIDLKVIHERPNVGDFEGRIVGLLE